MKLNLFDPTNERNFIYYDRCAIALDEVELTAARIRVQVDILASPLSRSRNLKYPLPREFFGYGQTFWQNVIVDSFPVEYVSSIVLDYWNVHGTLAHQLTDVIQRFKLNVIASSLLAYNEALTSSPEFAQALLDTLERIRGLDACFTVERDENPVDDDDTNNDLNTFQTPFNLLRFRFDTGTVFQVSILSWNMGLTSGGSLPGISETEEPYDTTNPKDQSPTPSGLRDPEGLPYGFEPPDSSPLDPELDPDDFSNAPDPEPPEGTILLQGWFIPFISGQQSESYAVGCPAGSLAESIPSLDGVQNATDLGTRQVRINESGQICTEDVLAGFPGFQFSANFFAADGRCGVTGSINCDG